MTPVEQVDRDAAADLMDDQLEGDPWFTTRVREGREDGSMWVQLLARHRLQAREEALEAVGKAVCLFLQTDEADAIYNRDDLSSFEMVQLIVDTAIRTLKEPTR